MEAHATVKKQGRRWWWTITVRSSNGQGHIYQGNEASWNLAMAMLEFTWMVHRIEWTVPDQIKQGVTSVFEGGVDKLLRAA